jgi:hypothetical protein
VYTVFVPYSLAYTLSPLPPHFRWCHHLQAGPVLPFCSQILLKKMKWNFVILIFFTHKWQKELSHHWSKMYNLLYFLMCWNDISKICFSLYQFLNLLMCIFIFFLPSPDQIFSSVVFWEHVSTHVCPCECERGHH